MKQEILDVEKLISENQTYQTLVVQMKNALNSQAFVLQQMENKLNELDCDPAWIEKHRYVLDLGRNHNVQ